MRKAYEASAVDHKINVNDWRENKKSDLKRIRTVYKGGPEAVSELIQRHGETPAQWNLRYRHYRNVPVTKPIIRTLAWLVYGKPPSIEAWIGERPPGVRAQFLASQRGEELATDDTSTAFSEFVSNSLEMNRNASLMLRAETQRIRDGCAPIKIWGVNEQGVPVEEFKRLRMDLHKTEDVKFVYDPEDPDQLLAAVEYRGGKWLLWTADEVVWVEADLSPKADAGMHPLPGYIPLIPLGDGEPLMMDLPDYQKVLINSQSTRWAVERATAFPIGVQVGKTLNQTDTEVSGSLGSARSISLGGGIGMILMDDGGSFTLVSPDADLGQLRESYKSELEEAMALAGGVPPDAGMMTGTSPEQPTTVALKWLRSFIMRDGLVLEAQEFEDKRMEVLAGYASTYSSLGVGSFDAMAADWDVTFPKNPLPHDDRQDRALAQQEVLGGLRLKADYAKEFVYPDATAEELREIMQSLDSGRGFSQEPPPDFGGEDE